MVDGVVVVERERDARLVERTDLRLLRALGVARLAQADWIVLDRVHHQLHIGGAQPIFPLQDGAHNPLHLVAARQIV
jgi:hypothetical protein